MSPLDLAWWTGVDAILWFQQFRTPWLDHLFVLITSLHGETFYVLSIAGFYWCVDRGLAARLAAVILPNVWLNSALKTAFGLPRPDPRQVAVLIEQVDPGLPSGHAQGSVAFWGYLAHRVRARRAWTAAIVLILAISLSRLYLGVHFPLDILAGWAIGLGHLAAVAWIERAADRRAPWLRLGLPALTALAMMGIHRGPDTPAIVGGFIGVLAGHEWSDRFWPTSARAAWWRQALKFAIGIAVVYLVRAGVKALLPHGYFPDLFRYVLIGLIVTAGVPWLFLRLGLAARQPAR